MLETVGKYWAAEQIAGEPAGMGRPRRVLPDVQESCCWCPPSLCWTFSPGSASRDEPGVWGRQHLGNTPLTFLIFYLLSGQDPILTTSSSVTQMVTLTWSKEW